MELGASTLLSKHGVGQVRIRVAVPSGLRTSEVRLRTRVLAASSWSAQLSSHEAFFRKMSQKRRGKDKHLDIKLRGPSKIPSAYGPCTPDMES